MGAYDRNTGAMNRAIVDGLGEAGMTKDEFARLMQPEYRALFAGMVKGLRDHGLTRTTFGLWEKPAVMAENMPAAWRPTTDDLNRAVQRADDRGKRAALTSAWSVNKKYIAPVLVPTCPWEDKVAMCIDGLREAKTRELFSFGYDKTIAKAMSDAKPGCPWLVNTQRAPRVNKRNSVPHVTLVDFATNGGPFRASCVTDMRRLAGIEVLLALTQHPYWAKQIIAGNAPPIVIEGLRIRMKDVDIPAVPAVEVEHGGLLLRPFVTDHPYARYVRPEIYL